MKTRRVIIHQYSDGRSIKNLYFERLQLFSCIFFYRETQTLYHSIDYGRENSAKY